MMGLTVSRLVLGYQKSTQTFLMLHMVYFNNMKSNFGYISCTWGPSQPNDKQKSAETFRQESRIF